MNLAQLETEQRNQNTKNIDEQNTLEILTLINEEDQKVAQVVHQCLPQISRLVDACFERLQQGGRVIYVGAGTSGRLGVLDASECPPTYGVDDNLFIGLIAGGYDALLKAQEGAEDNQQLAKQDLIRLRLSDKDTVIGLAASGRTPYVIAALHYAKMVGALTGSVSCVSNAQLSQVSDIAIEAVTGPEAVTGSTRMKAGTAQKLILNMISTSLMIKSGKVYQNLMVDVQPTNQKLIERAHRIIAEAAGCTLVEATDYFEKSGQNVKIAICMYLSQKDSKTCQQLLEKNAGNVSLTIRQLLEK